MKVCVRELYPYPGYEDHVKMNIQTDEGGKVSMEELQAQIKSYKLGEGTTMRDFEIPGVEEGTTLKLRDEALQYAMRLLQEQVPCQVYSAPRVTHGFCALDRPLTRWVHRGIAASLRREFGMEITEI